MRIQRLLDQRAGLVHSFGRPIDVPGVVDERQGESAEEREALVWISRYAELGAQRRGFALCIVQRASPQQRHHPATARVPTQPLLADPDWQLTRALAQPRSVFAVAAVQRRLTELEVSLGRLGPPVG